MILTGVRVPDSAMQTCGGIGRGTHLYRHHRRYRITEGSDEIRLRKIAQELFGVPATP